VTSEALARRFRARIRGVIGLVEPECIERASVPRAALPTTSSGVPRDSCAVRAHGCSCHAPCWSGARHAAARASRRGRRGPSCDARLTCR
jgi:hypothetical protein